MNENTLITQQNMNLIRPLPPRKQLNYLDAIQVIDAIAPDDTTAARTFGMTSAQAKFAMWTGYEIGLPFTAALRVLYLSSDGKLTLKPEGALALIQASDLMEKFEWEGDNNKQTVTLKRQGRPTRQMTLTLKEAKEAGWKSDAWNKTPANMLRWRIIGWLGKLDWNDILLGMAIADDSYMDVEITSEGDVKPFVQPPGDFIIENDETYVEPQNNAPETIVEASIPAYGFDVARLIEVASQADILEANNDQFPLTPEQINATVHNLVKSGKLVVLETTTE